MVLAMRALKVPFPTPSIHMVPGRKSDTEIEHFIIERIAHQFTQLSIAIKTVTFKRLNRHPALVSTFTIPYAVHSVFAIRDTL